MQRIVKTMALSAALLTGCFAHAQEPVRIGLVGPQSGNFQILGDQMLKGSKAAGAGHATIIAIDESCEDGSGTDIAKKLSAAKVAVAIGFLCSQSLSEALPLLSKAGIVAITLSLRSDILMQDALKNNWPLFRLAPNGKAEADKIIEIIQRDWKSSRFAILDDGTIHSRELADTVRAKLEESGIKPALIEPYRPAQESQMALIRKLAKTTITHALIIGDREDVAIIANEAKSQSPGTIFMGTDSLRDSDPSVFLPPGVLAVTLEDPPNTLDKNGAEGYYGPAYAALQVILAASEIAQASGAPIVQVLVDTPFETIIGPIGFTEAHELTTNPFTLMRWNGAEFEPR